MNDIKLEIPDDEFIEELKNKHPDIFEGFVDKLEESCVDLLQLFAKKNHDYGVSNITLGRELSTEASVKLALLAVAIRMSDKINRAINLLSSDKKAANETIADTFSDLTNYGIIATIVNKGDWK